MDEIKTVNSRASASVGLTPVHKTSASTSDEGEQLLRVMPTQGLPEKNNKAVDIDRIDTHTGSLRIEQEDVRLKNGKLDIVLTRHYTPLMTRPSAWEGDKEPKTHPFTDLGMGGGWSFSLAPKVIISGEFWYNNTATNDQLCTGATWWQLGQRNGAGPNFESRGHSASDGYFYVNADRVTTWSVQHVNGQVEPFTPTAQGEVRSPSGWKLTCAAGNYKLHGPDGLKYELTVRSTPYNQYPPDGSFSQAQMLQASKIVDAKGNYVSISYIDNYYPSRIASSDNTVFLDLNYAAQPYPYTGTRTLTSATDNGGRIWTYSVENRPSTAAYGLTNRPVNGSMYFQLEKVTLPDGTAWEYSYHPASASDASRGFLQQLKYPTGGTISYDYGIAATYHQPAWPWEYYYDITLDYTANYENNMEGYRTAVSRRVTSRSLSTGEQWNYSYIVATSAGNYDQTTITSPDGIESYKHIGWGYFKGNQNYVNTGTTWPHNYHSPWMIGLLVERQVGSIYKEVNEYSSVVLSSFWPSRYTGGVLLIDPNSTRKAVLSKRSITQDGALYTQQYSNWDSFGNPQTVQETGQHGGNRTTTLTYLNDTSKWIIGQPKDESYTGSSLVRTFDSDGQLLSINENGVTTAFTYDAAGNVATKTLPRNLVHSYSNYKRGVAQTEVQPEGISITRVVDGNGNVTSTVNGAGKTTAYTYDSLNRIASVTPPVGSATTTAYSATGKTVTRGALIEETQYDGFGRPTSVTLGGIATAFSYDAFGRLTFHSNPGASIGRSYEYDALSRLTRTTHADNTFEQQSFGAAATTITDERGKITALTYRAYGNPSKKFLMGIAAADSTANVSIGRNTDDKVTSITQGGVTRTFDYNANKYLTVETHPETGTTTFGRDIAGNMTSKKVGASGTTTFAYDNQNRLSTTTFPGTTPSVTFTYSKLNKILTASSSTGTRSFTYDDNGNVKSEQLAASGLPSVTVSYDYNGNDQLTAVTYPAIGPATAAVTTQYSPDVLGRPTKVGNFVTEVTYWPSGQIKQLTYANGTLSLYGQNTRLWPASFATRKASINYVNSAYGYDGKGNLTSIVDTADANYNRTMGYDDIDRLTTVSGPWGSGSIGYNGVGNITSQSFGSWNISYAYSQNQLTSIGGSRASSFNYDAYGNLISGYGDSFQFDDAQNLRCVRCTTPSTKIEYGYDGNNQRSTVIRGGVKTLEMSGIHGGQLLEYTPSANKLVQYFNLGGKRVAQKVIQ